MLGNIKIICSLLLWVSFALSIVYCGELSRQRRQFVFPDDSELTFGHERCSRPFVPEGICKSILKCREFLQERDFKRVKEAICGYDGVTPDVCCPVSGPPSSPRPATTPKPRVPSAEIVPHILPKRCGMRNISSNRIIGGRESDIGGWPWMTVIYIKQRGIKTAQCGGALVTNRHVITASHCGLNEQETDFLPATDLSVRLGEHNLFSTNDGSNPVDFPIKAVTYHQDFDRKTFKNDIAILTIDGTVTFTERIHPICLPYNYLRYEDLSERRPFVAGWGTTEFNGPSSPVLREIQVPIWKQEDCRRAYEKDIPITNKYMCAGYATGGKDACQGDSGGPLMMPANDTFFYLVGIVSFGKKCAQPDYPGVYTRVTEFLDWIEANMV
ncbi:proclotting enzyme-like [Tachypleus tridentatus]|uniref:proclotting enzyme-like n=1 Tax=Tachypleus tridentatus TaxID=6853 RepID=UPI003FD4247A